MVPGDGMVSRDHFVISFLGEGYILWDKLMKKV